VPLKRVLGLWSVVAFGVTNEIAAGLFFVSTQIQATSPGVGNLVPWLMLAGGGLTLLTVVAYRYFFASGLVGAGGEYVIIRDAVGMRSAFVATVLSWFGMTGALGTLAYVAPKFLAGACAAVGLDRAAHFLTSVEGTIVAGLTLLWSVWLVHVRGVRLAALLAVTAMVFVIAVALTLMVYGFATTPDRFEHALSAHLHLRAAAVMAAAPVQRVSFATAFGTALPVLFFGYLGLSTATQTGGEAADGRRVLARGVLLAVCIVTVVYTLFAFALYHAVPWQAIAGLSALKFTAYTTSTGLLGLIMPAWLSSLMNVFVALIVVKTFLPIFLAQSRWMYAWAQDGLIPAAFANTHARYKTPVLALTLSALLGSVSLLESVALGYVFGVNLRVLSVMLVFFFIGFGLLVFPKRAPALFRANVSLISAQRGVQIALGAAIMLFSAWFAGSIVYGSLGQSLFLQPAVQAAIVAAAAFVTYQWVPSRRRRAAAAADTARPDT
jgi:APA family basic amino acid/polyamine antiporter